jgi:fatty-acyl-CoA synthase
MMPATSARLASSYWPADRREPLLDITVGDLLRAAAAEVPARLALVEGSPDPAARRTWTYAELLTVAERTARALLARFAPGERIAVWAPNCPEWMLLQHGVSLAGMVLVTVNPALRARELRYVLAQSRAAGIFFADAYRGYDMADAVAGLRDDLPELREAIPLSGWDTFAPSVDVTSSEHTSSERTSSGHTSSGHTSSGHGAAALPAVRPGDPAQIQYTSGTTGFPKGAILHHRGVVNASRFVAIGSGVQDGGTWVNAMPMFHIGGGTLTELGTIAQRGTYVLLPGFDPGLVLELIEAYHGTMILAVPTMLVAMLGHPGLLTRDLSSLQTVMSGAAVVPASLVRRATETFGCKFTIVFGQTELHGVISQTQLSDSAEDQSETIGRPLPQVEVKISDPATGEVMPVGQVGEICARGYQTMLGYFGMPEETAAALDGDGWLRTGDLAAMDGRGYLTITGRLKDMIIRGGENIYPREIEDVLFAHPAVSQAAVVGLADEKWGERVAAVIMPADPANPPSPEALRDYCRECLASFKAPAEWFFVAEYPMTASGKIQKFRLQEDIAAGKIPAQPLDGG